MSDGARLPIAETFFSLQGEGVYTGTPMYFVRLAGCNVGRYIGEEGLEDDAEVAARPVDFPLVASKTHSICTTIDGQRFVCDTDYHAIRGTHDVRKLVGEELHAHQGTRHMCITGGEPFLHRLQPLLDIALEHNMLPHIETSGTLPIEVPMLDTVYDAVWITCSPKHGFLERNYHFPREWKFLAGPRFDLGTVRAFLRKNETRPVYLQPVQGVHETDDEALQRVVDLLLSEAPHWRLSCQLHKFLGRR